MCIKIFYPKTEVLDSIRKEDESRLKYGHKWKENEIRREDGEIRRGREIKAGLKTGTTGRRGKQK